MNPTPPKNETPPMTISPIPRRGIPGVIGILLYILLGVSALILPWGITVLLGTSPVPPVLADGISLVYLILLGIYISCTSRLTVMTTGKVFRGLTPIMILSAITTYYLFGSLLPTALIFSIIFVIGEGGVLLAVADKLQGSLFPLIPLTAFAAALVLTGRIDIALIACVPFPAALVLALGTRSSAGKENGMTRVSVICATSLTLGVSLAAIALWFIYRALGTLSPAALIEQLNRFRAYIVDTLVNVKFEYGTSVTYPLQGKETEVQNIVNGMINTLPATLVVLINITATFSQMLALSGLRAYGFGASLSPRVQHFRISPVSAAVFLLSWIVALVAVGDNDSSTMVGTVAENIFTVLMPGLAVSGISRFLAYMARRGARLGCGFLLIFLIPCLIAYIPTVIATLESLVSVFGPLVAKLKISKDQNSPSDVFHSSKKDTKPLSDEDLFERYCREQEERRKREEEDNRNDQSNDTNDTP